MISVLHLLDASTGWEQRLGVSHLLERLPSDRYEQTLATLGSTSTTGLRCLGHPVHKLAGGVPINILAVPAVFRMVQHRGIDLIHAWGARAASVAGLLAQRPVVVQLYDPCVATKTVKMLRAVAAPNRLAVCCSCQIVRRRLIERGLPPEYAVTVRPGVDFSLLNRARRAPLRRELGIERAQRAVLVPEPVTRKGGHFDATHAVSLHRLRSDDWQIILPGHSPEIDRIRRFGRTLPIETPLITPGNGQRFEELVAISDYLLITPRGDVATTCIAWAMAAGASVIGAAVHAVAELIAHKVNGLLFNPVRGRCMAPAIARLLRDEASQAKTKEAARGQAYEVFGLRRFVEQTDRLYRNLLEGRSPAADITDSAAVG